MRKVYFQPLLFELSKKFIFIEFHFILLIFLLYKDINFLICYHTIIKKHFESSLFDLTLKIHMIIC